MAKKVLAYCLLPICCFILLTGCTKNVNGENLSVTIGNSQVTGSFTGTLDSGKATGEGKITSSNSDGSSWSYEGTWDKSTASGKGKLTSKQITIQIDNNDSKGLVDRTGVYTGEVLNGLPNGQGQFTSSNSAGDKYTYTGAWAQGRWDGQAKIVYENSKYAIQSGTFTKGAYTPTSQDIIISLGTAKDVSYTVLSAASDFLKAHPELFPAKDTAAVKDYIDSAFDIRSFEKTPANYGNKLAMLNNLTVSQTWENSYAGKKYTILNLIDKNYNNYWCFYLDTCRYLKGDSVNASALPVAMSSYKNVGGGTTIVHVFVISYFNV
jgi:hypothetical protein